MNAKGPFKTWLSQEGIEVTTGRKLRDAVYRFGMSVPARTRELCDDDRRIAAVFADHKAFLARTAPVRASFFEPEWYDEVAEALGTLPANEVWEYYSNYPTRDEALAKIGRTVGSLFASAHDDRVLIFDSNPCDFCGHHLVWLDTNDCNDCGVWDRRWKEWLWWKRMAETASVNPSLTFIQLQNEVKKQIEKINVEQREIDRVARLTPEERAAEEAAKAQAEKEKNDERRKKNTESKKKSRAKASDTKAQNDGAAYRKRLSRLREKNPDLGMCQ